MVRYHQLNDLPVNDTWSPSEKQRDLMSYLARKKGFMDYRHFCEQHMPDYANKRLTINDASLIIDRLKMNPKPILTAEQLKIRDIQIAQRHILASKLEAKREADTAAYFARSVAYLAERTIDRQIRVVRNEIIDRADALKRGGRTPEVEAQLDELKREYHLKVAAIKGITDPTVEKVEEIIQEPELPEITEAEKINQLFNS